MIREIAASGHHIGCHSYQHELSFRFDEAGFREDTRKAKELIEDVVGKEINAFRAPGFSITKYNAWALKVLAELGFKYDCSLFPAHHDYGGILGYGEGIPKLIECGDGLGIKEFPINIRHVMGSNLVFSGGVFFRLFPYRLIRRWGRESNYMMSYFHPRDFDTGQPVVKGLPAMRRFKSYVGIGGAFKKFQQFLDDFELVNLPQTDDMIEWEDVPRLHMEDLQAKQ